VEDFLLATIDDKWLCNKCYSVDVCMLYRKVFLNALCGYYGTLTIHLSAAKETMDSSSPIADIFELKTSHLSSNQISFFKKWEALLTL
jgi:DNA replication ATP-dependent helicase Dna2